MAAAGLALVLTLAGCTEEQVTEPTDQPRPTSTPSLSWLTVERQERLADTVETIRTEHGWAAGCVFRYNAHETVFDEFERPAGTAAYSFVTDPELAPAVVLYVEGSTNGSGSYREHVPDRSVSATCRSDANSRRVWRMTAHRPSLCALIHSATARHLSMQCKGEHNPSISGTED